MKTVFSNCSLCFLNIYRTKTPKQLKLVSYFLFFKDVFFKTVFKHKTPKQAPKQVFLFSKN